MGHHEVAFFLAKYANTMHRAREKDAGIMDGLAARIVAPKLSAGTRNGHQGWADMESSTNSEHKLMVGRKKNRR